MIIESKFVDYWDCIARQYRDKTIVFKRHSEYVKCVLPKEVLSHNPQDHEYTHLYYIIFC